MLGAALQNKIGSAERDRIAPPAHSKNQSHSKSSWPKLHLQNEIGGNRPLARTPKGDARARFTKQNRIEGPYRAAPGHSKKQSHFGSAGLELEFTKQIPGVWSGMSIARSFSGSGLAIYKTKSETRTGFREGPAIRKNKATLLEPAPCLSRAGRPSPHSKKQSHFAVCKYSDVKDHGPPDTHALFADGHACSREQYRRDRCKSDCK